MRIITAALAACSLFLGAPLPAQTVANASPLEKTEWSLTALGDTPITATTPQRHPYLQLDPETHRVSGMSGCNRLMGSYELNGDHITFGQIAGTMMMCPDGMDTERDFLASLKRVTHWKIEGNKLAFLDDSGKTVASFAVRPAAAPPETQPH